ncbi:MAG TPA: Ig domain-containing protein, partial [Candidatus Binatia bacterium]|nr:Ig domain-containing protein [Candidatus Binatia bacterium]
EDYTLTIVFTDANFDEQTNTVPIHVIDQDLPRTNDFLVTVNFDRDITGFFTNAARRALVKQAAEDWAYFFGGMNLDVVTVGTETTYIWSNNFNGGYYFNNTNSYRGYQLYAYGTTNSTHRSGGEGNFNGPVQRSNNVPLTIKRSGGFEAEIYGNYNTRGWLLLTNDNDWLVTGNLGHETNDFYSIAHHEIGHALIFNPAHPGFNTAKTAGAFRSVAVTNYFGRPVTINSFDHLDGSIDPESGQGVFGYEYYGSIPRKRWLITKLDLLCAQEVGYALRSSSALAPLALGTQPVATATATLPFTFAFNASGGIPFYDWTIVAGALPPGVVLDPFTGVLSGTPATNDTFSFTLRLRDYRENSPGVTNAFTMTVGPPPPFSLALTLSGIGTNSQAQLSLFGTTGQRQVVETSSNLTQWLPLATNLSVTNYYLTETNLSQHAERFYRAVVRP